MPKPLRRSTILKPVRTDPESMSEAGGGRVMVAVWDPLVRLFHWSIVASFAVAWFSAARWDDPHEWAGYAAALLVAFRMFWGLAGTRHARFSDFVRPPSAVISYLRDISISREARYLGHNPAGGAMILALLAAMALPAFTGWLETTDAYYGVAWVQDAHSYVAHGMLSLATVHVGGVILASFRHRENLVRAMITGLKRPL
jgi:cytochrome b